MNSEKDIRQKFINKCISRDIYYNDEEKPSVLLQGKYGHLFDDFVRIGVELNKNAEIFTKEGIKEGVYSDRVGGFFKIPYGMHLLHKVHSIEDKLLKYYNKYINSQGDNLSISITDKGKWRVTNVNDYPMQHGDGDNHIFTETEFKQALKEF